MIEVKRKELADYLYHELVSFGYAPDDKTVQHISYFVTKYLIGKGAVTIGKSDSKQET